MTDYYRVFLLILPLIFAAGCTGLPFEMPGQDVIKTVPSTQEEGFRDVLAIKDINTIPKSPILAGQRILLSFIIENRDKEKEAKNVIVDLFDAPLLRKVTERTDASGKKIKEKGNLCNDIEVDETKNVGLKAEYAKKCLPINDVCTKYNPCSVLPGEQKQITYELYAPDDRAIASLQTGIDINFRVSYEFDGSTLLKVVVVNMEEIQARQRAGSPVTLDIFRSIGSGPVKIDAELKGNYILSGLGGTLEFNIKNAGDPAKGSIKDSVIHPIIGFDTAGVDTGLRIIFPKSLVVTNENVIAPKFLCMLDNTNANVVCSNSDDITLFKGESSSLLFQIKTSPAISEPFKSYDVKAIVKYVYELRDSEKITVVPIVKVQ